MYHVAVHSLTERVLSHIRRQDLLSAGDRVGVAVSGGIDSVALLRLLLELRQELGTVVSVVHFNHKLRGVESDGDQEFVASLAREFDLEFFVDGEDVAQRAAEEHVSVETAARELRYGFFRYLLGEGGISGAEAHLPGGAMNRSAESAAPPKAQPSESGPQGLKPTTVAELNGTAEAGPFPVSSPPGTFGLSTSASSASPLAPSLFSPSLACAASDHGPTSIFSQTSRRRVGKIATGHTLDDQAETVLMRIIRGTGMRGVGGIHPRILVEDEDGDRSGEIIRPLLGVRRRELERYLRDIGQPWREDSTNADARFTRNRVRNLVVPLLEQEFNPAVAENLAELAEIARGEEDYWENEISGWLGTTVQWSQPEWARAATSESTLVQIAPSSNISSGSSEDTDQRSKIENAPWRVMNASVSRMWFLGEAVAVQRRLVKAIGENAGIPLEFKHVEEILRVANEGASGEELSLPLGWKFLVVPEELVFVTPDLRAVHPAQEYEYELPVPGRIAVYEAGSSIEVRRVPDGADAAYNPDHLLDAESLPGPLKVRNWRPGDRFWPAHTKSPKKIKELLQDHHVAQPERKCWPVVVSGEQIIWVRGFPSASDFRGKPGRAAIAILDEPLSNQLAAED
jgi:tRNA(Ile)-lysidine synthetase-like protein